jgi:acyl-CoA synthetase (AMP-forming)/AMP-acid ligase II
LDFRERRWEEEVREEREAVETATSPAIPVSDQERVADEYGDELSDDEVGHILVRGPSVMKGYFGDKEATEAELDQVVVRSPYFKLAHDHHGEFQPLGSSPVALPRPESIVIEWSLSNLLLAGIYRAPRDGTFWLRDVWSAMEDYERRILLFYGLEGHLTDHTSIDDISIGEDMISLIWGS